MAATKPEAENRERILEAAERLFVERGIGNASLGDIAAESGVSRGTLYYYYKAKEDLIIDVADRHMARVGDSILALSRSGTSDIGGTLKSLAQAILADTTRNVMHEHLVHAAISGNEAVRARLESSYERWETLIRDELGRLGAPSDRAAVAAELLVALLDGLVMRAGVRGRPVRLEDGLDGFFAFVARYF